MGRRGVAVGLGLAVVGAAAAAWAVREVPAALGRRPAGTRGERVRRSPQYRDGAGITSYRIDAA